MILFNTTFNIDAAIENEWLTWARDVYFTLALDSGFVHKHHLMKLRYETENNDCTYSLQLYFENDTHLEKFLEDYEYKAIENLSKRFGSNAVYFQTLLDVVI